MNYKLPTNPNHPKYKILFHSKSLTEDSIRMTLGGSERGHSITRWTKGGGYLGGQLKALVESPGLVT